MRVLGWIMVAFGFVGLAVEVQEIAAGRATGVAVGLVLSGAFILGGLAIVRARSRSPESRHPAAGGRRYERGEIEPAIFQLAEKRFGRVTPVEVASNVGVPFDVAQAALEDLRGKGACQVLVTAAGVTVYRFPELEEAGGKRDMLE